MKDSISLVLVGAGGMGQCYLKYLFKEYSPPRVRLLAVVEPQPEKSASYAKLMERRIPI
jgi:predicted dehydrogenase